MFSMIVCYLIGTSFQHPIRLLYDTHNLHQHYSTVHNVYLLYTSLDFFFGENLNNRLHIYSSHFLVLSQRFQTIRIVKFW